MKLLQRERAQRLTEAYKIKSTQRAKNGKLKIPRTGKGKTKIIHPVSPLSLPSDSPKKPVTQLNLPRNLPFFESKSEDSTDGPVGLTVNVGELVSKGSDVISPTEDIDPSLPIYLLVEIVSASNLPIADILSSDPYCLVHDGNNEIHRTKRISKK